LFSPGSPIVTSNGPDNPIVWVLDANVYRSDPLIGGNVNHPVLYALDGNSLSLLWNSSSDQLNVGGKYNHAVVAHGTVLVGTDRIQAFGLNAVTTPYVDPRHDGDVARAPLPDRVTSVHRKPGERNR
jgi:outer membrane protein assembly factor BamB